MKNKKFEEKYASPSFILFCMVLIFIVGAFVAFVWVDVKTDNQFKLSGVSVTNKSGELKSTTFDSMTVNLVGSRYYLKVKMVLEHDDTKNGKDGCIIKENEHRIIETALITLRSKTILDVSRPGATEDIKNELVEEINKKLGEEVVNDIYFVHYVYN